MFIVKYDTAGNVFWAHSEGGIYSEFSEGVAADAAGNVLVTGFFESPSITFGITVLTNAGSGVSPDLFVVKYDGAGNVLWANSAGGTGDDAGRSIATDATGNVLVTGFFISPSITFGTTPLTTTGGFDIFIVKYAPAGNVLWANSAGGTEDDRGRGVATDAGGNVLVTGEFYSPSITFGTTVLTNAIAGDYDMFIAKLDNITGIAEENYSVETINIFPNPFSGSTTISFSLPQSQKVSFRIVDMSGRLVTILADKIFETGENEIIWNAKRVNSGIYFLRMETVNFSAIRKLIVEN
jgi:hypothetical protein